MRKIKIMMMMPLFLAVSLFFAGCGQSVDNDNDVPSGGDVPLPNRYLEGAGTLYVNDEGLGVFDASGDIIGSNGPYDWADPAINTIEHTLSSGVLSLSVALDDDGIPRPLVPTGKTLILKGSSPSQVQVADDVEVVVDGALYLTNKALLSIGAAGNSGTILLNNGRLFVTEGTTLRYGTDAVVNSISRADTSSALKGAIEFWSESTLDFTDNDHDFIRIGATTNVNHITLSELWTNSNPATVKINQGTIDNDDLLKFDLVSPDRLLYVDGGSGKELFDSSEITINAGLEYVNIRSDLEHKNVTVNGSLSPGKDVYAKTLTIGADGQYFNDKNTVIDDGLVVNGFGSLSALAFTNTSVVTVAPAGTLVISAPHGFNYSPTIDGTLVLGGGATLYTGNRLNVGGELYILNGAVPTFTLGGGILEAKAGDIRISGGSVTLDGDSTLTVSNSLALTGNGMVKAGGLVIDDESTGDYALEMKDITLTGGFTVAGGTDAAQITVTGGQVTFGSAATYKGALVGAGDIVFKHNMEEDSEPDKSFIFTGKLLSTDGAQSSLILGTGQSIVFGGETVDGGVSFTGGTYHVESEGSGTRFALGYLPITGGEGLGLGIGRVGPENDVTSLALSPDSHIRFAAPDAYLLVGSAAAQRISGEEEGSEESLFSISGTLGTNGQGPSIRISNVIIAGSLGNVTGNRATPAVPLFTYDKENLGGTAATGVITVDYTGAQGSGGGGGSLTIDHNYTWTYTANGWVGNK
jgi:hypothetical protein